MKKIVLGIALATSVVLSQELTQYEVIQKLNKATGKIVVKQNGLEEKYRKMKSEISQLIGKSKLIQIQKEEIFNLNKKVEILENRIKDIEKHLSLKNSHITDEVILKIKEKLRSSLNREQEFGNNEDKSVKDYVVNTWALNVRGGNSENHKVVGKYRVGSIIKAKQIDSEWVKVKGEEKFLGKALLTEKEQFIIITTKNTIIRNYPSFKNKHIKNKISKNNKLSAVAKLLNGEWYLLNNGSFINKRFVREL